MGKFDITAYTNKGNATPSISLYFSFVPGISVHESVMEGGCIEAVLVAR
jgi:hypothetical protein